MKSFLNFIRLMVGMAKPFAKVIIALISSITTVTISR